MLNRLSIFAEPIARLLEAGELPQLLTPVTYLAGVEHLGAERPKFDADTVGDMALGLLTEYWMHVANSMVTGTSVVGWAGCMAVDVRDALRDPTDDLLLTDRRLRIVHQEPNNAFTQRWQAALSDIVAVRRIPRLLVAVFDDDDRRVPIHLGRDSPPGRRCNSTAKHMARRAGRWRCVSCVPSSWQTVSSRPVRIPREMRPRSSVAIVLGPRKDVMYSVVDALSGPRRRHRVRRTLAYALGVLVIMASFAACLPSAFFVAVYLIEFISSKTASLDGVDRGTMLVLIGSVVAAIVLWRIGVRLIRGHRHLVLFLRKFGFTAATEALSVAVASGVGRQWRLVTLDDHDVAPIGVGRGSRWSVRALRLMLVVATVVMMVAAVRALSGDAFKSIADQAHDTALQQTDGGSTGTLSNDIGAAIGGVLAAAVTLVVVLIIFSTMIAFAGSGGLLLSAVSRSATRAERSKATVVTTAGEVEKVAQALRRRTKRVLSPRIVVARVSDAHWQAFVRQMAKVSDTVLVDVSRPTDNLVWEVRSLEHGRTRWLPIGDLNWLHALERDTSPAASEVRRLLANREVLGYRPDALPSFSKGLRHSLDVAAARR